MEDNTLFLVELLNEMIEHGKLIVWNSRIERVEIIKDIKVGSNDTVVISLKKHR